MSRRRTVLLIAASTAALATAVPAFGSAATYRARVNGICRTYTPQLRKLDADTQAAQKAGDLHRVAYNFGLGLALALRQDAAIEAVPVPTALRTQLAPTLRLLKNVDGHARKLISYSAAGNGAAATTELQTIAKLSKPLNGMLDSVGLRDCGSNQ
jgi:hypothetical protein